MNDRQRFLETMHFGNPDKVPLEPGWPRESTLRVWHQQGLADHADWQIALYETLGIPGRIPQPRQFLGVNFAMLPTFEERILEHRDDHYLVQDWMGAIVEISDQYDCTYLRTAKDFVTRKWHRFPVQTRQDWINKLQWRYDPRQPGRLPADFSNRCHALQAREHVLRLDFNGPFWQLREWCGFEGLCLLMMDEPGYVQEMVAFWEAFILRMLEQILAQIVPDHVQVSEDMAYKGHSMISPVMVRRFLLPTWKKWTAALNKAGCPVVTIDSDGFIGELIPIWIEAGFDGTWPVEVAAGNDLLAYRKFYGNNMAYGGGIDKRLLAAGGQAMHTELKRITPVIRGGGYIPGCDHGVPPDIAWPDFVEYTRLLAHLTGWL
jgi:hypothetical protein